MQTQWKAILDPLISESSTQLFIGTPKTSTATTTSAIYVALTDSPTVTFKTTKSATFIIFCALSSENSGAGNRNSFKIAATNAGATPQILFTQVATYNENAAADSMSAFAFTIAKLQEEKTYTFVLQAKTNGGTLKLRNDYPDYGCALVALEVTS